MAMRSIASLSLTFGLVAIPVKLYSATESSTALRFKWMSAGGGRVRQQYVTEPVPRREAVQEPVRFRPEAAAEPVAAILPGAASKRAKIPESQLYVPPESEPTPPDTDTVVERSTMLKGYEYERGQFVLFSQEELKALEAGSRKTIDIVNFIPEDAVDPIYYDKAYFLAPDKGGAKPYSLLLRAMQETQRCALARWAFRSKEYVAQIRASGRGIVLQQLLYANEVRSFSNLQIEPSGVTDAELALAKLFIEQISAASYDPTEFIDEEKQRILAAVADKIAGRPVAAPPEAPRGAQVIDLMAALRASLQKRAGSGTPERATERKPAKRARSKHASEESSKKRKA